MALFSIQDALIKFVYEEVALYELYFGRTLTALILLICYLKFSKQRIILKTHYPFLTIVRVICFFFGFSFFYISLTFMSLAEANALFFSSPFFVSILATIFLKEKVGIRRWSAILVGFVGVFIVLNPDFNNFDYMKLAPVICALCYSISMTITKITSDKDNNYTQLIHLYMGATIISILIFYIYWEKVNSITLVIPHFNLSLESGELTHLLQLPFIIAMGTVATFSFYFVLTAYSIASPSVVSIYEYSLIIWSIITGFILFDNIPTLRTFIGVMPQL